MTPSVSAEVLAHLWPRAPARLRAAIVEQLPEVCARRGIDTPQRLSHFLAQISHESDGGTIVRESMRYRADRIMEIFGVGRHSARVIASEARALAADAERTGGHALAERVYGLGNPDKADELGNTSAGDGWKFRGGGLLQETGKDAYRRASDVSGVDLLADPDLIADPAHALDIAAAAFATPEILADCDRDDVVGVTRHVNGGKNGLGSRRQWLAQWRLALREDGAAAAVVGPLEFGARGWRVRALQTRLAELGYAVGRIDETFGPQTRAAVLDFQARNDLAVTGAVDDPTQSALDHAAPREVSKARSTATAADVADHPAVRSAEAIETVAKRGGGAAVLLGLLDGVSERASSDPIGAAREAIDKVDQARGLAARAWEMVAGGIGWIAAHPGVVVAGVVVALAAVVVLRSRDTVAAVVERHRAGLDLG